MTTTTKARRVVVIDLRKTASPPSEETDGGRWMTMCMAHGDNVQHATRALAQAWAALPETWCAECHNTDRPTCTSCGQIIEDDEEARETTEGWACSESCGIALTGQDSA